MKYTRCIAFRYCVCTVIVIFIDILILANCVAQNNYSKIIDVYDFPVRPGTREWAALTSHDEMLQVCQIPEVSLRKISTKGLTETVLDYPLYGDMLAYNSLQEGFDIVVFGFNGLQDLLRRKDAGVVLLARYRTMNPTAIDKSWGLEQQGKYAMDFMYIEMLLSQDAILTNLTDAELRDLLVETMAKMRAKQQYAEIYGPFSQERTALLLGRALRHMRYASFEQKMREDTVLSAFVDNGTAATDMVMKEILMYAQQFISD